MNIDPRSHPPHQTDNESDLCDDNSPSKFGCTRRILHAGLHVAHVELDGGGYAIAAVWDGNRTTDGDQP